MAVKSAAVSAVLVLVVVLIAVLVVALVLVLVVVLILAEVLVIVILVVHLVFLLPVWLQSGSEGHEPALRPGKISCCCQLRQICHAGAGADLRCDRRFPR